MVELCGRDGRAANWLVGERKAVGRRAVGGGRDGLPMTNHKWYLPFAAAAATALSLTGVSLADNLESGASAKATSSASHQTTKSAKPARRAHASALGGVGVQIVREQFNLPAGAYIDKAAACPGGTSAVGGGFDATQDGAWPSITLLDSFPTNSNGWTVRVHNASNTNALRVYAVVTCAN